MDAVLTEAKAASAIGVTVGLQYFDAITPRYPAPPNHTALLIQRLQCFSRELPFLHDDNGSTSRNPCHGKRACKRRGKVLCNLETEE